MLHRNKTGQTVIEYIIIIGIVTIALFAMGPAVKRGVQAVVRGTADQMATQESAEQSFDAEDGHLDISNTQTNASATREVRERLYTTTTVVKEKTKSSTKSLTDMGFTPDE